MFEGIKQILTGSDNQTHDIGSCFGVITGLSGLFFQGWAIMHNNQVFNMQDFGVGAGALAVGVGALLKLKENTEPNETKL
jgi:hypothetical protein